MRLDMGYNLLNKGVFLLSNALSSQFNTYIPPTPFEAIRGA